jgi:FlaA1/EpsC-like NDP-sugar epimerase
VAKQQPVSVTHPEVTRYFMTIPEAASLVIEASVMANGGETYVLDMGKRIKILDLIERYVSLTDSHYPTITYTGLRAGEKLHEELFDGSETRTSTAHPRISRVHVEQAGSVAPDEIRALYALTKIGSSREELRSELKRLVSGHELLAPVMEA